MGEVQVTASQGAGAARGDAGGDGRPTPPACWFPPAPNPHETPWLLFLNIQTGRIQSPFTWTLNFFFENLPEVNREFLSWDFRGP